MTGRGGRDKSLVWVGLGRAEGAESTGGTGVLPSIWTAEPAGV